MKIYGYRLPKLPKDQVWLDKLTFEDLGSPSNLLPHVIDPEGTVCAACHIYTDEQGRQYVGFDLKLQLDKEHMDALFNNHAKKKIYPVCVS